MPTLPGQPFFVILISYLLGCFSTGYYLVRIRTGQDIRTLGSGSTGGRNVGRLLGAPGFLITMLGDLAKGALATWLAFAMGLNQVGVLLAILAVVAGHIWPVQLRFHGGKGLATALGAGLVYDVRIVMATCLLAGLFVLLLRRITLGGLIAVALTPATAALLGHNRAEIAGITLIILIILIAHRTNLAAIFRDFDAQTWR